MTRNGCTTITPGRATYLHDLPANLIEAIFLEAGVLTKFNINLTASPIPPVPTELSEDEKEMNALLLEICFDPVEKPHDIYRVVRPRARLTRHLMLTCKLFYRQTVSMLCRYNHVLLRLHSCHDLQKMLDLSAVWLERLERLTIELCGPLTDCTSSTCKKKDPHKAYRSLSLDLADDELYINKWHKVWREFSQSRLPATPQLSLQLVCRITDRKTAYALLQPMLHHNRRLLKHCSIRMHGLPKEANLRSLAAATVLALTSDEDKYACAEKAFNFFHLPCEIRYNILQYTELVSYSQEIHWRDKQQYSTSHCHFWTSGPAEESHLFSISKGKSYCCIVNESERAGSYSSAGYFCQTWGIAASSDSRCRCCKGCWQFPVDLILVSRQMHQEAMEVFFRYNKMVVLPNREELCMSWMTLPKRLPISTFISRHMTANQTHWHNLRFLDIVIPCIISASCCDAEGEENNALQDWAKSLVSIRDGLNLSQLTIQITIARWHLSPDGSPIMQPRSFAESTYMACYARLLRPLSVLSGLARLYILLPRIDTGQAESLYGVRLTVEEIISRREQMESVLETMIMGETYNAKQAGKCLGTHSRWLREWHAECYFWYLGD